jgi:hypothetical protein
MPHESPDMEDTERRALTQDPITRPPSYGAICPPGPENLDALEGEYLGSGKVSAQTVVPLSTLLCLLLQHTSR